MSVEKVKFVTVTRTIDDRNGIHYIHTHRTLMSTLYPDCYDEWSLCKYTYDGDHKMYETLFEGTEEECRQYAYDNYTDKEQTNMCLMDWEGRDWQV